MNESFNQLIKLAVEERERRKNFVLAIRYLEEAINIAKTLSEFCRAFNQLGLTYYHLGDLEKAEEIFRIKQIRSVSDAIPDNKGLADASRHLARLLVDKSQLSPARAQAEKARELAIQNQFSDRVWFTSCLFYIRYKQGARFKDLLRILLTEILELRFIKGSLTEISAWISDVIFHAAVTFHIVRPTLWISKLITKATGMKLMQDKLNKVEKEYL